MICLKDTLKEGKEHQSSGCRALCNFILQKKSISKWYLRYVKLVRYSLLRSVPFLGRRTNRIWGNYGILGKFVQIGIWCILIISSSWVSNRVNKLRLVYHRFLFGSSAKCKFHEETQRLWIAWFFREKEHFRGCTSWDGEKYIDLTLS